MKFKIIGLIIFYFILDTEVFSQNEMLFLPLKNKNGCSIFSSVSGEKLANFPCEEMGKPSKDLIPVKFNQKWGYVNSYGNWIIPPIYEYADNFYNDLARVKKNQKYGFINKNGEVVIDFKFLYVGNFLYDELAPVQCSEKHNYLYGYINKKGELMIPCEFQSAYEFRKNIARVRKWDLYGYIFFDKKSQKHHLLQNFSYRLAGDFGSVSIAYVLKNQGFFYVNPQGKIEHILDKDIIPDDFSVTDPLAKFQNLKTGLYGFYDKNLKEIIPPIFLEAETFYLGFARVAGPKNYQNIHVNISEVLKSYERSEYEEFYIDTLGRRITFTD